MVYLLVNGPCAEVAVLVDHFQVILEDGVICGRKRGDGDVVDQTLANEVQEGSPGGGGFGGEGGAQLFSEHFQYDAGSLLRQRWNQTSVVSITLWDCDTYLVLLDRAGEGEDEHAGEVDLGQLELNHLGIIQVVDDEAESGEGRVADGQEFAVLHQFRDGDIGDAGEHFLGLGVSSEQSVPIQGKFITGRNHHRSK